jgi:hypothetical protein
MAAFWGFVVAVCVVGCCIWGVWAGIGKELSASPASKSADMDRRRFFMMDAIVSYVSTG